MGDPSTYFLDVNRGDAVLIENEEPFRQYIGRVIECVGGSKDPNQWTLFQVIDIDTGVVEIIHASNVKRILESKDSTSN